MRKEKEEAIGGLRWVGGHFIAQDEERLGGSQGGGENKFGMCTFPFDGYCFCACPVRFLT